VIIIIITITPVVHLPVLYQGILWVLVSVFHLVFTQECQQQVYQQRHFKEMLVEVVAAVAKRGTAPRMNLWTVIGTSLRHPL
jgi:hypothetical protein